MVNFSVALIARNEAKTLPRLIASLKDFQARGGEILVVDTGSTDNTAEIARSLGCKVTEVGDRFRVFLDDEMVKQINERFVIEGEQSVVNEGNSLFDFASARNFAASLTSNDMLAMPDCDEVYTALDIDKIEQLIRDGATQFEYLFIFSHDEFGKPTMQFNHSKFYDRRKLSWSNIVHEILVGEAKKVFLPEETCKLEHFQNEETNRSGYLKGLAVDCFLHPDKDRQSHYFARECFYTGRYRSAIKEFQRHIALHKWEAERAQSWLFIGDCHSFLGEDALAIKAWQESYTVCGDRREPLIRLAGHYQRKNDYKRAAAYASASLVLPSWPFYSNEEANYTYRPHEILYWALWYLDDKLGSKGHYDKAFAFQPLNPKFIQDRQFYY